MGSVLSAEVTTPARGRGSKILPRYQGQRPSFEQKEGLWPEVRKPDFVNVVLVHAVSQPRTSTGAAWSSRAEPVISIEVSDPPIVSWVSVLAGQSQPLGKP
jgi:hypothetical protein